MSLWEYGAALHHWNRLHPDPSAGGGSDDDGAPEPTEEEFAAMREAIRAANLPDVRV